ncbi:hypothetical protein KFK09_017952 [Dendrobium nobile]|nr:hypothetical protein KFK09_017952 [Dendrobium nobile]
MFEKMLSKIQDNVGARLDRVEDILEKLQADQDSLKYKFIEFQMQCDHNPDKPHVSTSASTFQSVNFHNKNPSGQAPIQDHPPPPPPPPPLAEEILPQPPIPPPPPPPLAEEILPQSPIPPQQPILPTPPPPQKRKRENDEKEERSSKPVIPYVKKNKEVISVENIIVQTRPALEKMDYPGKQFLTEENQRMMDEFFKKFNTK